MLLKVLSEDLKLKLYNASSPDDIFDLISACADTKVQSENDKNKIRITLMKLRANILTGDLIIIYLSIIRYFSYRY